MKSKKIKKVTSIILSGAMVITFLNLNYAVTVKADTLANDVVQQTTTVESTSDYNNPPRITLIGANPMTIEAGSKLIDPGAIVRDFEDGTEYTMYSQNKDTFDTRVVRKDYIDYIATDNDGNSSGVERVINIVDTTPPKITLKGPSIITLEVGSMYYEYGYDAEDVSAFRVSTLKDYDFNMNRVGVYDIHYEAIDEYNNRNGAIRKVVVEDKTPPEIISSRDNYILEVGDTFNEPTVYAGDTYCGEVAVTKSGSVDVNAVGDYTLTYTATDSYNNTATKNITVKVRNVAPPVITLNGDPEINVEIGTKYNELGASAFDEVDGECGVTITGRVNTSIKGVYTINYSAKDSKNNISSADRKVHVVDTTPPVITLNGGRVVLMELGDEYEELGATVKDNSGEVLVIDINPMINENQVGEGNYVVYTATDSSGNRTEVTREVEIDDTTAPTITLNGKNPTTVEIGTPYIEDSANVTDLSEILEFTTTGEVNTSVLGDYEITYTAKDCYNNTNSVTRIVNVVDTTAPEITLNGNNDITLFLGEDYKEEGATVKDNSGEEILASCEGVVDTSKVGTYTITYTAKDSSGNSSSITRTVKVIYKYGGILQPINSDGSSVYKAGSTVPIKFQLKDINNAYISKAIANISYIKISDKEGPINESTSTTTPTTGSLFRYDIISNQYIYNLSTKGLTAGTYKLTIKLDDGKSYDLQIGLR